MYRALIRLKLDDGCQAYASAAPTTLKMLDPVHNLRIRLAIGTFRTSPTVSLYAESGEPPLPTRQDKLCLQFYTRLLRQPITLTYQVNDLNDRFLGNPSLLLHRQIVYRDTTSPYSRTPGDGTVAQP